MLSLAVRRSGAWLRLRRLPLPEVILLAVRWYLRFGLSYRDVEELLAERGIDVDHVSVYRRVRRFTPLLVDAAHPCRHAVGDRWHVDETYLKVSGPGGTCTGPSTRFGEVVDVLLSTKRDARAARQFFTRAMAETRTEPAEVVTDRTPGLPGRARRTAPRRLPQRGAVRPQGPRGRPRPDQVSTSTDARSKTQASAQLISFGRAFVQNLRRGHYELAVAVPPKGRLVQVFAELAAVL